MRTSLRFAVSRSQLSIVFDGVKRQEWQKDGACIDRDPLIFDECRNGKEARAICAKCPVTRECLKFALTGSVPPHGTFGSITFPDNRGQKYNRVWAEALEALKAMEAGA